MPAVAPPPVRSRTRRAAGSWAPPEVEDGATDDGVTDDAVPVGRRGLRLAVETPENVILEFTLAGPTRRAGAYLIDFAIRGAVWFAVALAAVVVGFVLPGLAVGGFLVVWFVLEWGYHTLFEGFRAGRTPGKQALGLRVVRTDGGPVTFWPALTRTLLRAADALPFPLTPAPHLLGLVPLYGVGLTSVVLTERSQRLGDLLAGTLVIHERPIPVPREPVILEKIDPLPAGDAPGTPPSRRTLATVEEFLARRHVLPHARGHALAAPLARALARRVRYRGDATLLNDYPMAFLARLWVSMNRDDDPLSRDQRERSAAERSRWSRLSGDAPRGADVGERGEGAAR